MKSWSVSRSPLAKDAADPLLHPPPDVLGHASRVILTAAMTGSRMSELSGLRPARGPLERSTAAGRRTYVRGEHDDDRKSELSAKRSVLMATLLAPTIHVITRILAEIGRSEGEDLETLRTALVASPRA
jgi:hypothetical protein